MTILLSSPRLRALAVHGTGEPLVTLTVASGPAHAVVRAGLAHRLAAAADALPPRVCLRVVQGHRSIAEQRIDPTEWWHWSYGDRYWALMTCAGAALYGPVGVHAGAA